MLKVSEIFGPTIQGEGALIGMPTVFVRLGGCDYRCSWCDTLYAVLPKHNREWVNMTESQIIDSVENLSERAFITLSGGNPALQDCQELIDEAWDRGHCIAMETQGSISRKWFNELDHLVLSPKPPSSGVMFNEKVFMECLRNVPSWWSVKIVVKDMDDYRWAHSLCNRMEILRPYLQPCNEGREPMETYRALVDLILDDPIPGAVVLPQLHLLAWGGERGV
jgi:7-carboxy-7-deazaguanine synthase